MKKLLLISSILGLTASVNAGERVLTPAPAYAPQSAQCFYAGETSFDVISIFVDPTGMADSSYHGEEIESGFGAGIGVSHFFTKSVGLRGGAYWWDTDSIIHSVTASAVVRYPIEELCLAPYVFGGVGGHFDSVNQISAHLGAGVEYRLTDRLGIIADYSYTFTDETADWNMYSLGLRVKF